VDQNEALVEDATDEAQPPVEEDVLPKSLSDELPEETTTEETTAPAQATTETAEETTETVEESAPATETQETTGFEDQPEKP